jgi:ABC-2 type transport system permease protein
MIGLIILARRSSSSISRSLHPVWMLAFLVLTCLASACSASSSASGRKNFEQLQLVPLLVITPLVFLGGSFYSISMLPPFWQTVTLFNPVVYLISGFRWPTSISA